MVVIYVVQLYPRLIAVKLLAGGGGVCLPADDDIFLDTFFQAPSLVGAFAKSSREISKANIPENKLIYV